MTSKERLKIGSILLDLGALIIASNIRDESFNRCVKDYGDSIKAFMDGEL